MPRPDWVAPTKVIAVHLNYRSRAAQRGRVPDGAVVLPQAAVLARRPTATSSGPRGTELLAFEGEIAVDHRPPVRAT